MFPKHAILPSIHQSMIASRHPQSPIAHILVTLSLVKSRSAALARSWTVMRVIDERSPLYQITPEKFLKDLQKRNGLVEIYDQLANEKVMEFLQNNAKIETVPTKAEEATAPNPS